jgi:hypothetical protein
VLEYHPTETVSLLHRVTQFGSDGVTSLPPTTFEYSTWTPPDSVSGFFVPSTNEPPGIGLNSGSVELIDLNADGLPDLLTTISGTHSVYVNNGVVNGELRWTPFGVHVPGAFGVDLGSMSVHLGDADADGLADLMVKSGLGVVGFYRNTGALEWEAQNFLNFSGSLPLWPFEDGGAAGRTLDLDHNRRSDVLYTTESAYRLWLLGSDGVYSQEVQTAPLSTVGALFQFDTAGAHIADLNGDRLQDLVLVQSSRVIYWPNRGFGEFGDAVVLFLDTTLFSEDIARTGFADVNGDGLADLTLLRSTQNPFGMDYWLNLGHAGLDQRRTIGGLPSIHANDALRWADMNGNGSSDIVISNSFAPEGQHHVIIDLVPGVRPNLLTQIDNGLGLVTTLEYETSVDQMIAARESNDPWSRTMPISVPVVSRIIEDYGIGPAYTRAIRYRDPYFNAEKQEFRGFA